MPRLSTFLLAFFAVAFLLDGCNALTNPESSVQAMKEFDGHPPGVSIFLPQNGGSFQAWFTYEYTTPDGAKFDKTVYLKKSVSTNDVFIPARFGGASPECAFAPRLKRVCIDHGRHAHSCSKGCINYSGIRSPTPGSTNWKQCLHDRYRSCSFWRCSCKGDTGVDVVAYGENGQIVVPASIENASHCARAFEGF